eukprot:373460_1
MFNLVGILQKVHETTQNPTLTNIFSKLTLDDRSWKFLSRAPRPDVPVARDIALLEKLTWSFASSYTGSSGSALTGSVMKLRLSEESKIGKRILGLSSKL